MKNQLEMMKKPWDVLIILDACRYDAFEKLWSKWLRGKLTKVRSAGSCTIRWLKETWPEEYDLVYFSGSPYVNTAGVPAVDHAKDISFCAIEHFTEIIDVWNFGWYDQMGTVLPEEMNKAVLNYPTDKRMIIHYVQPHYPYIGRSRCYIKEGSALFRNKVLGLPRKHRNPNFRPFKAEKDKRAAYKETLDLVLQRVSELIPHLKGKIVVTTDHGELLGENGIWGHPIDSNHPALWKIPWFEVKKQ